LPPSGNKSGRKSGRLPPQVEINEVFEKNLDNRRARAQQNRYFCLGMLLLMTNVKSMGFMRNT
jgi:hypothetical protein